MRRPALRASTAAIVLVAAAAAALRLVDLGGVRLDPFYDAAVRSMGLSWHNFFFGAYEPSGSVSIDKPPVDLWLQVGSTKLLGWGSFSLKLPQALAGIVAVPLLYGALRNACGELAALTAAAALAVMPIEVITARSDTMDAVMMALLVAALFALVRACDQDRATERPDPDRPDRAGPDAGRAEKGRAGHGRGCSTWWLVASAAAMGLAFEVKLLESLVALPGLLTIAWLARGRLADRRAAIAAVAVYLAVALSWLTATLAFPAHQRPWAIGSTDGSAWNAAFVFNGSERITGKAVEVGQPATRSAAAHTGVGASTPIIPPSPTRLLARSGQLPARWLGWLALAALLLGTPAVLAAWRSRGSRPLAWALAAGLLVWLLTGLLLFSSMERLHPRYVEGFTPAVAGMLGLGATWIASVARAARARRGRAALAALGARLAAALLAGVLAVAGVASVQAVNGRVSDAGEVGAMHPQVQRPLSSYLRAHQGGARYELAAETATGIASLIAADARPVLMLTTYNGRPFTSPGRLQALAAEGEVRYAYLDSSCGPHSSESAAGCARVSRWVRAHGQDVSRQAGLPRRGLLWRLPCARDCRGR